MTTHPFMDLLSAREGHFRYESGYHSDLWLELDLLFLRPRKVQPFVSELAEKFAQHGITAVCGPLIGGALVAEQIAAELDIAFFYTERVVRPQHGGLYPVEYPLPKSLREAAREQRVAIVDDVISAGSAVRGTLTSLQAQGADVAVVGALLVLGDSAAQFFEPRGIPIESIVARPSPLWKPEGCPLCRAGVPLEDVTDSSA
ncbi:MAG: orotate phosphoribosyltransferase [Anaerolineae bacterium]|nr:orotate phosphoribosyltransferase [Anaerolineae bacterium]